MSTTFVPYIDIISEAPSYYKLRDIFIAYLDKITPLYAEIAADRLDLSPKHTAEDYRGILNRIRFVLDDAESILDAATVLEDLRQCFTPAHTPVPEPDSVTDQELPI